MSISIFDVTGPVMIGPSSSHTAGAARLGRVAAMIVAAPISHVRFGLHGSFAKTYRGHGTDKALVAGVLGLREDDEGITDAFALARDRGLSYEFYEADLKGMHENSVRMDFTLLDGTQRRVAGSSVGGGQILICEIDGIALSLSAQLPTLIIRQYDKKGVLSNVTRVLADRGINIGVMKLSRSARGQQALCVIETDNLLNEETVALVRAQANVISVQALNPDV